MSSQIEKQQQQDGTPTTLNNNNINIRIEDDYIRQTEQNINQQNSRNNIDVNNNNNNNHHHMKNQMSAIEEEDRLFLNSNTEAMTISQIDNYLLQSTLQGDINNYSTNNINLAEQINNITDADLRKQLMRYDTEDIQNIPNDLSYSNLSQLQQSLSHFVVENKDEFSTQNNILSGIKNSSVKGGDGIDGRGGVQFQFDKSSKYFLKFLNGDNLNDSSFMQSTSVIYDNPQSQRIGSKDMRSFMSELNSNNQDTNVLRAQLIESTQRYKQTLVQNKILIDGYEKLKQQVDDLTKQVNNQQNKKNDQNDEQDKGKQKQNGENNSNNNGGNSSSKKKQTISHEKNNSFHQKHEELQKQLHDEIVNKLNSEIESLRQKNLELMQQKAELENNNKSSNFRILELQSQLNAKDTILKEKNSEIKKLFLQNETYKIEIKHIESLNGLLSQPIKKTIEKITGSNNHSTSKLQEKKGSSVRKGSFYSEINHQNVKERVDSSQVEYQKELSVKSVNIPRNNKSKLVTESNQFLKDDKIFNKSANQYYSSNVSHSQQKDNLGNSQKISIEKIHSEIKQLKNSLMSTDRLLRSTKTKNQVLSEKVGQAELINSNLDIIPKSVNGNNSNNNIMNYSNQENSSSQIYQSHNNPDKLKQDMNQNILNEQKYNNNNHHHNHHHNHMDIIENKLKQTPSSAQFKHLIKQQQEQNNNNNINDNNSNIENRNQIQLNETSQSEINGVSNFTSRDLSQNIPTPTPNRYQQVPAFQSDKLFINENNNPQIQQQFISNAQNFTLQNQAAYDSHNQILYEQTPSNINSNITNQFIDQSSSIQNQFQNNQNQFKQHIQSPIQQQQIQQQQQQYLEQDHVVQNNYSQQQQQQQNQIINDQFNDNLSYNSQQIGNRNHHNNKNNNNNNNIENNNNNIQSNNYYSSSNPNDIYQIQQQQQQQQIQQNKQMNNSSNQIQNQFLSPQQSSQKQNVQGKRPQSSQQMIEGSQQQIKIQQPQIINQQTPQNIQIMERQPSQNLSDYPINDKNGYDLSYRNSNIPQQQQQQQQQQFQGQSQLQYRYSQPQLNAQFNQLTNTQSPNCLTPQQQINPFSISQSQIQSAQSVQSQNAYHNHLMSQGHPPSIYYPPQLRLNNQVTQSQFFQPTNSTLQQSANLSQYQFQFSNYLNTYSNNQNRSSVNTISSMKGENLKKLNQSLTELELEKNLIETKIMKEQSKKYSQSSNRNAAVQDLNQKLQQINLQIEEVRYAMMEQAV